METVNLVVRKTVELAAQEAVMLAGIETASLNSSKETNDPTAKETTDLAAINKRLEKAPQGGICIGGDLHASTRPTLNTPANTAPPVGHHLICLKR